MYPFLIRRRLKIPERVERNMSYLKFWDSMEELPARGEWLRKNRRPLAVIVIMFILFPTSIVLYNYSNDGDTEYEIAYSVTVWILPLEEEFSLNLQFFSTRQNAEEQTNWLQWLNFDVQPSSDEEHIFHLANLPEGFSGFWVRMFLSDGSDSFTILNADVGSKKKKPHLCLVTRLVYS